MATPMDKYELTKLIEDQVNKCIDGKCELIGQKALEAIEKGQKVRLEDVIKRMEKADADAQEREKKAEEKRAKDAEDIKKDLKELKEHEGQFQARFIRATKDEHVASCPNCKFDDKTPFEKEAGACSNPGCKSKYSNIDKKNGAKKCMTCGAEIKWKQ